MNKKTINVYLDDEREAPEGYVRTYTVEQTIRVLMCHNVEFLSLDHDLGYDKTGYDVLTWIEDKVFNELDYEPPFILIHSQNPVGRDKMLQCVNQIKKIQMYRQIDKMNEKLGF